MTVRNVFRTTEMLFDSNRHVKNFLSEALNRRVSVKKYIATNGNEVYKTSPDKTGRVKIMGLDALGELTSMINKITGKNGDVLIDVKKYNKYNCNATRIISTPKKNTQITVNNGSVKYSQVAPEYDSYEGVKLIVKDNDGKITEVSNASFVKKPFFDQILRPIGSMLYPR